MGGIQGGRTWTDEQLARLVASRSSWRSVARDLGLKGTSSGVIRTLKRRAAQLGLDVSHFRGNRTWSDADLQAAIAGSRTWSDVLRAIDVSDTADARARVSGRAIRLGLDTEHLQRRPVAAPGLSVGALELRNLRDAAPALVAAWFALRGCPVAVPLEPQEYDLLVTFSAGVQRIQVKSTTYRGDGRWEVGIGRHPYSFQRGAGKVAYDPTSIDAFAIVRGDGLIYLIPMTAVAGKVGLVLDAYSQYVVGSAASLLTPGVVSDKQPADDPFCGPMVGTT